MDDMTAFDRLIANTATKAVGPPRAVDGRAVVRSAKAAPAGRWSLPGRWFPRDPSIRPARGFSMFGALKFVAAAAIVALFGGFLLAGFLTTPQGDDVAPAAVTESPSPMTSGQLLSGMVTEEVEPRVYRVINDGVRDLSYPVGEWGGAGFIVDVTPDGSVWLSALVDRQGMFRLGEEPVFEYIAFPPYREVAPDGSLWGLGQVPEDRIGIFSFDGGGWMVRATMPFSFFTALVVGPDGTVWVVGIDEDKHCPDIENRDCHGTALLRLEDDGSLTTIADWADVHDGDADLFQLAVSADGDVWLVGTPYGRADLLLRFDGEGWAAIPGPEGWDPGQFGRYLDVGPDGALWVRADARGGLARFDDPGWTTFRQTDGVERWDEKGTSFTDRLIVAPDGSVWLSGGPPDEGCGGVTHYHGTTWTSYLAGSCIEDFAIAPDGSVWLGAAEGSRLHTYVITPEAVDAAVEPPEPDASASSDQTIPAMTSIRTDVLAGATLTFEEVERGVFRVVDDGVRDLTAVDAEDIVAGYDDGVWLVREDDFVRLGSDSPHERPDAGPGNHAFEVAPDGTMWVIPFGSGWYPRAAREGLRSTDGEHWTVQRCPPSTDCQGFAVLADGSVWASWKEDGGWRVGHLGPTGWQPLDGYARSGRARGYHHVFVTDAGDTYGLDHAKIYRFEDGGWEFVSHQPLTFDIGALVDVGRDGTVWLGNDDGLTRIAGGEKEHWTTADILGPSYDFSYYDEPLADYVGETQFRVAPDGSLWFSPWQRCPTESGSVTWCGDGLARFDGQTLDRFLRGRHISMDVAADGSVWVLAAKETLWDLDVGHPDGGGPRWVPDDGPRGLYVITPETETPTE